MEGCYNKGDGVMVCNHCGAVIPASSTICAYCDSRLVPLVREVIVAPPAPMEAKMAPINPPARVIPGPVFDPYNYLVPKKNKWVSLFLCIFLGFLGIHKFYEGKIVMGLLYLFTGGLFWFGCLIDFFILLFKPHYYVPKTFLRKKPKKGLTKPLPYAIL